jgi:hypothetical protein
MIHNQLGYLRIELDFEQRSGETLREVTGTFLKVGSERPDPVQSSLKHGAVPVIFCGAKPPTTQA